MSTQAPTRRASTWTRIRLGLAALWAVIMVAGIQFGERSASLADLESALTTGRVSTVRVTGGLLPGDTGSTLIELRWRDHHVTWMAEVEQASSGDAEPSTWGHGDGRIVGDVTTYLAHRHPGVHVVRQPGAPSQLGLSADLAGWRLRGWLALPLLIPTLATLYVLLAGPEPWRATRWAWFWIMSQPLAGIGTWAFLLLSGPTPSISAPHRPLRRLRGGWAFVLANLANLLIGVVLDRAG
ncbi:MAG: hypothetical protein U0Q19_10575 [Kineosporiaceae bacterium]